MARCVFVQCYSSRDILCCSCTILEGRLGATCTCTTRRVHSGSQRRLCLTRFSNIAAQCSTARVSCAVVGLTIIRCFLFARLSTKSCLQNWSQDCLSFDGQSWSAYSYSYSYPYYRQLSALFTYRGRLDSTSWVPYEFPMEILYGEFYETLEPHIAHHIEEHS